MMFPSNDPFAYPIQPMSTLESLHGGNQGLPLNMQLLSNPTTGEHYKSINTPFYGPLPSIPTTGTTRLSNSNTNHDDGQSTGIDGNQAWGHGQGKGHYEGPPTGSGWDAMFGEDWSGGWTDQGYRQ